MTRQDREPGIPLAPDAQVVSAGLVPALEQPARARPARPIAVAGVVIGFLAAVLFLASAVWTLYARSVVGIALAGVEASVSDDLPALARLIPSETAASAAFKRARVSTTRASDVRFGEPVWRGTVASVSLTAAGKPGSVSLAPSTSALGEAVLTWTGAPFGDATGTVVLTDERTAWRVLYIIVGKQGASFAPEDAAKTFAVPGG